MSKKRTFISTAIPYVNAEPHIGFALELIQTDAIARYKRLAGNEVFFLTGTDENSLKNVQAARAKGVETKALVDDNAARFRGLKEALNISFNDFIRTTEKRHIDGAHRLWKACKKDIYKKSYKGLYCVGCELFYKEGDLIGGLCPEHKTPPEIVEEENYFFRLSNYQKQLEELFEKEVIEIYPSHRRNEVLGFIRQGLEDFSISRSISRAGGWGIAVPEDEQQIMYVWFDALTNYINALGYATEEDAYNNFWKDKDAEIIHVIGKGVLRFHAVYWPAMLLSAGVALPKKIIVHGYVTLEGEKMSKSLGNVVNPVDAAKQWGIDQLRYFLLREIPPFEDGDYSVSRMTDRINADLAHGLGNFISRSLTMMSKQENLTAVSNELASDIEAAWKSYREHMEGFRLNSALEAVWKMIGAADKYINDNKPWSLAKTEPARLEAVLSSLWYVCANLAGMLEPFMPDTSRKIAAATGIEGKKKWEGESFQITKPENLFGKIE